MALKSGASSLHLIILLALLAPTPAFANEAFCSGIDGLFKWTFTEKNLRLQPADLLPQDFITQVSAAVAPVELAINHTTKYSSLAKASVPTIEFWCHAGGKLIGEFILQAGKNSVIIEGLRLENPIPPQEGSPSRDPKLEQNRPGLPATVFRHAKNQILKLASRAEHPRLETGGCQNFSVLMLYRRGIGMKPSTPFAETAVAMLDRYYEFARQELPEALRIKSVQEFTAMLGSTNFTRNTPEMQFAFAQARAAGFPESPAFETFRDQTGAVIAVRFYSLPKEQAVSFVDHTLAVPQLLEWSQLTSRGGSALAIDLAPP